jgi:hypothetical protein
LESNPLHAPVGRFKTVGKKKSNGATYTPDKLASFVAKGLLKTAVLPGTSETIKIFDPAAGDGQLLMALIHELKLGGYTNIDVHGFDIDASAIEKTKERIQASHPDLKAFLFVKDFLADLASAEGVTEGSTRHPVFDLIIANPPYVRTQVMGADAASALADKFGLQGRVDLYYAFLLGLSQVMHDHSKAGIIVSNRFMTTKAGGSVRKGLWSSFLFNSIWDFGDTRLFDAAVLPAVLFFGPRDSSDPTDVPPFISVYTTSKATADAKESTSLFESLSEAGIIRVEQQLYEVKRGSLHFEDEDPEKVWRLEDSESFHWINTVKRNTFCTFRDIGKVRVGIKTTADSVFIRKDWSEFKKDGLPELLKPLVTHHIARRYRADIQKASKVLYTHQILDGKRSAIDLEKYPYAQRYLAKYRDQLTQRKYVIEAGRNWYEIWVPQDPAAWEKPKIVFRDISEKPTFWMDLDGSVVNGDCYWIYAESEAKEKLLWLALAVANSTFIESFYDYIFNNKLYAGRRRFMTQYVEQFPIPNPADPRSQEIVGLAKLIYDETPGQDSTQLEARINDLVWELFGLAGKRNAASCHSR